MQKPDKKFSLPGILTFELCKKQHRILLACARVCKDFVMLSLPYIGQKQLRSRRLIIPAATLEFAE